MTPTRGLVTHLIKVRVADVDAAFVRARDFGARVLQDADELRVGERSCVLEDLGPPPLGTDADGA
jgi:uncharacterized glyoxalase superfamily protein PhnB